MRCLIPLVCCGVLSWGAALAQTGPVDDQGFTLLFREDGPVKGWRVTQWNDLAQAAPSEVVWRVEQGILHGSTTRGTWLVSERQYTNFILEFEFKLGETGNSGCALRAPLFGDPAFDGMELQMADLRYNPKATEAELAGGLYRAVAPRKQVYRPLEWNHYRIALRGPSLHVILNGEVILDLDLREQTQAVKRHDGNLAPPLKDRPRHGHIGFQELSRGGSHVQIRNARLKELP